MESTEGLDTGLPGFESLLSPLTSDHQSLQQGLLVSPSLR